MRTSLFLMVLGTIACIAAGYLGIGNLYDAPNIVAVFNMRSLNGFVGWALVLFMALLPIVCLACILWGWFSYFSDRRDAAFNRLFGPPALVGAICALLYGLARVIPQGM